MDSRNISFSNYELYSCSGQRTEEAAENQPSAVVFSPVKISRRNPLCPLAILARPSDKEVQLPHGLFHFIIDGYSAVSPRSRVRRFALRSRTKAQRRRYLVLSVAILDGVVPGQRSVRCRRAPL